QKEEARKFGLAGGLDDSGSLPEGYSSFVGRCPAVCRRAILLSSEDVRQLAGGLFFFRRRKKNQERRHPFERVDGAQENQSPLENRLFGDVNRGTASLNAPAVAGTAPCGADSRYDRSGRQAPKTPADD